MPAEPMILPRCGCCYRLPGLLQPLQRYEDRRLAAVVWRGAWADVDRVPAILVIRHNQRGLLSLLAIGGRGSAT